MPPQILGGNGYAVLLIPRPAILLTVTRLTFYSARREKEGREGALEPSSTRELFLTELAVYQDASSIAFFYLLLLQGNVIEKFKT